MSPSNKWQSGLLALELVNRTHARAVAEALLNLEDLRVVGRDDEDVVKRYRPLFPLTIDPGRVAGEDLLHETADGLCLFGRRVLISAVRDGKKVESRPGDRPRSFDGLLIKPALRAELAVVEELGRVGADRGMEPPGLFEEHSLVRGYRLLAAQDVIER